jgi:hypothetical protein
MSPRNEERPLWRTAWFWKQSFLYLVVPLIVALSILTVLIRTHHLSQYQFGMIRKVIVYAYPFSFTLWINHQARKRTIRNIP